MNEPLGNNNIFGTPVHNVFGARIGRADLNLRGELEFRDTLGSHIGTGRVGLDNHSVWSGHMQIGNVGIDGRINLK